MTQRGMTLIELMVALVIAASLGTATVMLLDSLMGVEEQVSEQTRATSQMDATFRQLQQAFKQMVMHRPVRESFGLEPAVRLEDNQLTMVQNGWYQLPNDDRPRSAMRRVSFALITPCPMLDSSSGCIVRSLRPHLDTTELDTTTNQYLLTDVSLWSISLLTQQADAVVSVNQYPLESGDNLTPAIVGVEVFVDHDRLGKIKRTFYVGQAHKPWAAMPEESE